MNTVRTSNKAPEAPITDTQGVARVLCDTTGLSLAKLLAIPGVREFLGADRGGMTITIGNHSFGRNQDGAVYIPKKAEA